MQVLLINEEKPFENFIQDAARPNDYAAINYSKLGTIKL